MDTQGTASTITINVIFLYNFFDYILKLQKMAQTQVHATFAYERQLVTLHAAGHTPDRIRT